MPLKLMYITNKSEIASIAEASGVDWIFIDLETHGKEERQKGLDTVKSLHSITDIVRVKSVLKEAELLVRVNPIHEHSKKEVNDVIEAGADIVMLPYFKTEKEVEIFVQYVSARAKVVLLLETPEAVANLDSILSLKGIDYIHIGLNDLHLGYKLDFMFEPLASGLVESLGNKILMKGIPFGFGGVANIGEGLLPAENIIAEHYRLNSSMVILSRSFCDVNKLSDLTEIKDMFTTGLKEIRKYEKNIKNIKNEFYKEKQVETVEIINKISNKNYRV